MNRRIGFLVLLVLCSVPAFAQDKGFDVKSYSAEIHLDRQRDSIWGVVSMSVHSTAFLTQLVQHAKYLTIDTVRVGLTGNPLAIHWVDTASGTYMVDCNMPAGRDFTLVTQYHGNPRPEQTGGNWGGVTVSDSMMFAMGVGLNAPYTSTTRHWLPCYDLPDDKADSVDFVFWTDSNEVVASNGLLADIRWQNGKRRTHWIETKPIASYLMTFAVGPYTTTDYFSTTGVGGQMFALQRDSVAANLVFTNLIAPSVAFFDSLFVPYPFEKVGYVVTPIGSMEHQTMICLDKHVLGTTWANTTPSHELAHQWWGDWVTCKTFDDAWLNEGFATYCEALIHERFQGHDAYISALAGYRKSEVNVVGGKMKIDSLPIYAAATANHHDNNYPPTIYKKGAVVLGMLRSYLGDALFFAGLRSYGTTHAYGNVTTADLQQIFESMSGQNLSWFFRQFVYERGAPVVDVKYKILSRMVEMELTQVQDSMGYRYFRMPLKIEGPTGGGGELVDVWLDSVKTTHLSFDYDYRPDSLIIDPGHTSLLAIRSMSETLDVATQASTPLRFDVYPNPAKRLVKLVAKLPAVLHWQSIEVLDSRGVRVLQRPFDTTSSEFTTSLDVRELPSGSYTLQVVADGGRQYSRRITIE